MHIIDDLLILLSDGYRGPYRIIRNHFQGGPASRGSSSPVRDQTLRITLSRLKKKGLVENQNGIWKISEAGQKFVEKALRNKRMRNNPKDVKRNMIIAFDIPETLRKKRHWLRSELVALHFKQLQRSVWFGPSPLPQEFIKALGVCNILQFMKFFKAAEEDIV